MLKSQKKIVVYLLLSFLILILNNENIVQASPQQLGDLPKGSIVKDVDGFNEPWIVLGSGHFDHDSTLLLLEKALPGGGRAMHNGTTDNWEVTNLRGYLRGEFYNSLLSSNFQSHINQVTTITSDKVVTDETVFLLSAVELGSTSTFYSNHGSKIEGIDTYVNIGQRYWTRSPNTIGSSNSNWRIVSEDGQITSNTAHHHSIGVRPAVHLNPNTEVYGPYTSKGKTYYTLFDIEKRTITFNSNGGSLVDSKTIEHGTTLNEPSPPSRTGYTFNGWYTDQNLSNAFDFSTPVTEDMTLYAKWVANTYTVTFNAGDGDVAPVTQTKQFDSTYDDEDALPVPTRIGYTFLGWNTKEDGTGDEITNKTVVSIAKNHTLYAQWKVNEYTVTFEDHDGTVLDVVTVNHGDSAKAPSNPTREGYTFTGWNKSFENVTKNLTVTAQYDINQYTVTFNSNGGSSVESISADYNTKITEPKLPTRTGYTFKGWYTDGTFNKEWNFETEKVPASNLTLHAKWTANKYTVTFDAGDGDVAPVTQTKQFDSTYDNKDVLPVPTRIGYTFLGWNTKEDGTGDEITNKTVVSIAKNHTLYAQWKVNEYTVTFNSNGGSSVDAVTTDYNSKITEPNSPTRTGYTFEGWYTDGTFSNEWDFETDKVPASNLTLYAKWASNNANLKKITISEGTLEQSIDAKTTNYTARVGNDVNSITLTLVTEDNFASLTVNGKPVISGESSEKIPLHVDKVNKINIQVTAEDGSTKDYAIHITRLVPVKEAKYKEKNGTVQIDTEDVKTLEKDGTIIVDLKDKLHESVNVHFTQEQMQFLKNQNAKIRIQKEDVTLIIPAANFSENQSLTLIVKRLEENLDILPAENVSVGAIYDFTLKLGDQTLNLFDYDIELIFPVDGLGYEKPEELQVYYWNENTDEWELVGGEYNNGNIHVKTNHFSIFAVFHPSEFETKTNGNVGNKENTKSNKDGVHLKESSKDQQGKTKDDREGELLPATATNMYNLIAIGIILIILGSLSLFLYRSYVNRKYQ